MIEILIIFSLNQLWHLNLAWQNIYCYQHHSKLIFLFLFGKWFIHMGRVIMLSGLFSLLFSAYIRYFEVSISILLIPLSCWLWLIFKILKNSWQMARKSVSISVFPNFWSEALHDKVLRKSWSITHIVLQYIYIQKHKQ